MPAGIVGIDHPVIGVRDLDAGRRVFERLGHRIERITGGPPEAGRGWGLLGAFLLAARLHEHLPAKEDLIGRGLLAGLKTAADMTPERWGMLAELRAQVNAWTAEVFERVDLLLTPTVAVLPFGAGQPPPREVAGHAISVLGWMPFTFPFNMTGQPAASVPAGFTDDGLPVGLQIIGRRNADGTVLAASAAFEAACPWSDRRPPP
jgi:aspartyl-tRNA(Asn)/glutamyl-tRNA(Gln) amidotransferase subunit A